jgi:hypothetical protein
MTWSRQIIQKMGVTKNPPGYALRLRSGQALAESRGGCLYVSIS